MKTKPVKTRLREQIKHMDKVRFLKFSSRWKLVKGEFVKGCDL